ncbi:MAG: class I SAM-dependent methyltransferase [Acidobacteriia bacterium]|nr:class I SAM-dependent methyltransferase [Terriglobia bacterium]
MIAERPSSRPEAHPACPICATPGAAIYALVPDRLFGIAAGSFHLHQCRACGCIFQHPLPEPAALASFYPEEYWWSEDQGSKLSGALSRMERAYREFVAMDHVRFLERCAAGARGRSLLDIGCGSGTFLHLARRRGFLCHGMDVSARAVAAAREQYDLLVRQGDIGGDAWDGNSFDFITMFHVLEHLHDPRHALTCAGRLLKPGGSLILQVPNASSFQARLLGARWYGLDVPRHLINFTPEALTILLGQAGFSCQLVSRFSLRDNPASLASSLATRLDPIGRRGRGKHKSSIVEGALELCYFGLVLLALPPALIESLCGHGGTIWVHARSQKINAERAENDESVL